VIFGFDHPHEGGLADVTRLVGGKGASLWAMTRLGLPVPPGFTIAIGARPGPALDDAVDAALAELEATLGRRLGDPVDPLLVSVRSGAARSMPGMMDTLLNVGLTDAAAAALSDRAGDPGFGPALMSRLRAGFAKAGMPLPEAPRAQLSAAIRAVHASWNSPRAIAYRTHEGLDAAGGTAVTVQAMVFGNRCNRSATGVAFSRDPMTGAPGMVGDLLFRAQGEDVVSGAAATRPLADLAAHDPRLAAELADAVARAEAHWRDLVDIEFTIESGRLWILQARPGKRSAAAAARIAVELADDPRIRLGRAEAVARAPAGLIEGRLSLRRRAAGATPVTCGIAASPGLATGRVALTPDAAIEMADAGPVILVRAETSPEDVHGMSVAAGVLTSLGGPMSHAALVAREWDIPCVVGARGLVIGPDDVRLGGHRFVAGDEISIDGATGEVFAGAVAGELVEDPFAATLRAWAEELERMEA